MNHVEQQRRFDAVKRALDVVGASALLVISAPIQLLVAGAVAIQLGRPILFKQQRPGLNGQIFTLRKFRTMRDISQTDGFVSDDERLTQFGRILRSTSMDELPTLWNVIRGDMSLVGPRPLLVRYMERYSPEQARRHEVRPGVTGLAQASGRNALSWAEKFALDVEYVDSRCVRLDVKILAMTVLSLVRRDGISAVGEATMGEFIGQGILGSSGIR